jgi:mono/diheme cytochrome c family protein
MTRQTWTLLAIGLGLMLVLSACGSPNPQPVALTPVPTLASAGTAPTLVPVLQVAASAAGGATTAGTGNADAAAGAAVFLKNCTQCHGIDGQGIIGPALRNNKFIQTGAAQDIFDTIAQGRPGTEMPAWLQANGGPLTTDQINNVAAYLHSLQNVEPMPTSTPMPLEPTETPEPPDAPTPEPAQPSGGGNPGPAAALTGDAVNGRALFGVECASCHGPEGVQGVPNPGSDDGSVPPLNPIDSTLVNADPKVFAANLDLFLEHGSLPEGDNPLIKMPSFGDSQLLTPQQIADLIAYVMQLNTGK